MPLYYWDKEASSKKACRRLSSSSRYFAIEWLGLCFPDAFILSLSSSRGRRSSSENQESLVCYWGCPNHGLPYVTIPVQMSMWTVQQQYFRTGWPDSHFRETGPGVSGDPSQCKRLIESNYFVTYFLCYFCKCCLQFLTKWNSVLNGHMCLIMILVAAINSKMFNTNW